MKELFLYAPGANSTNLIRSLAINGINTFAFRIVKTKELAEIFLERSGKAMEGSYISYAEAAAMLYKAIRSVKYFENLKYVNCCDLIKSINELRMNIPYDEETLLEENLPNGIFKEKNEAILSIYEYYMDMLKKNNRYDEIMLIRYAMKESISMPNILVANEFPLKPLEEALYMKLTNGEKNIYQFGEKKNNIKEYVNAYGEANEVEYVLNYIFKNNIPLDEVTVACATPNKYVKYFKDYAEVYNYDLSTSIGDSIIHSKAGKLLKLLNEWVLNYYDTDSFINIINSPYFNKSLFFEDTNLLDENKYIINDTLKACGALRLSFNEESNNVKLLEYKKVTLDNYEFIEKVKNVLNMGIINFLDRYTITKGLITTNEVNALNNITGLLSYAITYDVPLESLIESIPFLTTGAEVAKEGSLYLTTIPMAKSNIRKYLFVVGLSSDAFPGSPKEDCIVLDEDYKMFGVMDYSIKNTEKTKNDLLNLVKINESFDNEIHLVYSELSLSDLKIHNASSVMFEIYKAENGEDKDVDNFNKVQKSFGYQDSELSKNSNIVRAYIDDKIEKHIDIVDEEEDLGAIPCTNDSKKGYSASSIVEFFNCERRFFYKYYLGIPDPFEKDPLEAIQANDYGTLCHAILEEHGSVATLSRFLEIAEEEYNKFLVKNVPITLSEEAKKDNLDTFKDIMTNAFEMRNMAKVATKETDHVTEYEDTGIIIHGLPDLVEQIINDDYRVVDYKVKNKIDHDPNDSKSIVQIMLYAYIYEKYMKEKHNKIVNVKEAEFQYLKQKEKVKVQEAIPMKVQKEYFHDLMCYFVLKVKTGNFAPSGDENTTCRYCKYADICKNSR